MEPLPSVSVLWIGLALFAAQLWVESVYGKVLKMSVTDEQGRAQPEDGQRPFIVVSTPKQIRRQKLWAKTKGALAILATVATTLGVVATAIGVAVNVINASALRRQNLQQAAAAQIRMLIGEGPLVQAKEIIDITIRTRSGNLAVYDFRHKDIQQIEPQIKKFMNGLETTAGLIKSDAIDRNVACRALAQYYLAFSVGLLGFDDKNTLNRVGTRIIPDHRPSTERFFKDGDFRDIKDVVLKWFGTETKWFPTDDYDGECDKVAPPLTLWDEFTRWLPHKNK